MHYIYALCSSNDYSNIRYIGQTNNPDERIKSHFKKGDLISNTRHNNWIKKNVADGNIICMKIIESNIPTNKVNEAELFYMKYYRKLGYDLTNATDDNANTIHRHSAETRAKISKSLTGVKHSEERRLQTIESLKRRIRKPATQETKDKISRNRRGIPTPKKHRLTCPHCGREGEAGGMKQWHFNKCKHKKDKQQLDLYL
jgi:hypothetical protein